MEIQGPNFKVIFLKEAREFIQSIPEQPRKKLIDNVRKATYVMEASLFKKLNDEIWEFRTRYNGMQYRLLAFWDKVHKQLVVATHGFVKKTQKTPTNEIERAIRIMNRYYNEN